VESAAERARARREVMPVPAGERQPGLSARLGGLG